MVNRCELFGVKDYRRLPKILEWRLEKRTQFEGREHFTLGVSAADSAKILPRIIEVCKPSQFEAVDIVILAILAECSYKTRYVDGVKGFFFGDIKAANASLKRKF